MNKHTDSLCFSCKHFSQTGPLHFTKSGKCVWVLTAPALPAWLNDYLNMTDDIYGPKSDCGVGAYSTEHCDAYEKADETVVSKRKSETWYEA